MAALRWRGSLALGAGLAVCWLTLGSRMPPGTTWAQVPSTKQATLTPSVPVVGTASCSGRACHGGLEPLAGSGVLQDEHTTWLLHDKHADAYRVLFKKRSQTIAKNLGGKKPAHEDVLCLACHTNPLTATAGTSSAVLQERFCGVGCESCHGPAQQWLREHTTPAWKAQPWEAKRASGMIPVADLPSRIQACAGCHVGAAPEGSTTPLRDVNHDLIGAGHPRLDFEFGAFQANMPPHWTPKEADKMPGHSAQAWALGQLSAAQAALKLLAYRASTKEQPWPEFAEYDCFACHHSLVERSDRQQRGYGQRRPGSIPWGTWYFSIPHALATPAAEGDAQLRTTLDELAKLMQQPYPERQQAAEKARQGAAQFDRWLQKVTKRGPDPAKLFKVLVGEPKLAETSWDSATQLYLGLFALAPAQGKPALLKVLPDLGQKQAFPPPYDSPGDRRSLNFREDLRKALEQMRP